MINSPSLFIRRIRFIPGCKTVRLALAAGMLACIFSNFLLGQDGESDIFDAIELSLNPDALPVSRQLAFVRLLFLSEDQIRENAPIFAESSLRYLEAIDPDSGKVGNPFAVQMSSLVLMWSEFWPSGTEYLSSVDQGIRDRVWIRILFSADAVPGVFSNALTVLRTGATVEGPFRLDARSQLASFLRFNLFPTTSWIDKAAHSLPNPQNEEKMDQVFELLYDISQKKNEYGEEVAALADFLDEMLVEQNIGEIVFDQAGGDLVRIKALRFLQKAARDASHRENDIAQTQYIRLLQDEKLETMLTSQEGSPYGRDQILGLFGQCFANSPDAVRAAEETFEMKLVQEDLLLDIINASRGEPGTATLATSILSRIADNADHRARAPASEQLHQSRWERISTGCGNSLHVVPGGKRK